MKKEDCFELGMIKKTHGLEGEVVMHFDADNPEHYAALEVVFIEESHQLVPYVLEYLHPHKDGFIAKIEEIEGIDQAQNLVTKRLFLPLANLPRLKDGQFYYHEIIGYSVVDKHQGKLGTVENVHADNVQALILMRYQQKEVLIPINDEIILRADHNSETLEVDLPDGLLEVYTEEL